MTESEKNQVNPVKGKIIAAKPFDRFVENVKTQAKMNAGATSGSEIAEQVLTALLEAETLEEAFERQDSSIKNGKDMIDVDMTIRSFEFLPADAKLAENSLLGVYARITAVNLFDGEEFQFATGAPNIIALLWKAQQTDRLPLDCVIKAKDTANGQLLTLRALPKRVMRG